MKTTTILSTVILAFALSTPAAFSADKKKAPEAATEPAKKEETKSDAKKDHYPLYGQLLSLTDTELTVKGGEGKPDRKFTISKTTTIKKDGKAATVKDAVTGQWVSGYVKNSANGGTDELESVNLSPKQKDAKTETKEKEEKKPAAATPKKKAA
ncbi:MAG: hypothetical protein K8R87_06010 [Verrucomicrobia bacterium]|nr:hypothetical protein [Verrucomicrobiota bacterium]